MKFRISRIVRLSESIALSTRSLASSGALCHQERHVLERQGDAVDRLDDPVVQVAADPLPLLDDGETLDLLVEVGVVDRDAGAQGEHLDEQLVDVAELGRTLLVGQVQVADGSPVDRHGHAEEGRHRRVIRREPVRVGVFGDPRDPVGAPLADDQPEETVSARWVADGGPHLGADPARDEPLHPAGGVGQPEGCVFRTHEGPDSIHDDLEDRVEVEDLRDRACRVDQGLEFVDTEGRRRLVSVGRGGSACIDGNLPVGGRCGRPGLDAATRTSASRPLRSRAGSHYLPMPAARL